MGEMESDLKQKLEYRIENYEEFEKFFFGPVPIFFNKTKIESKNIYS